MELETAIVTRTLLTVADYAALDEPEGARHELSDGELIVSPSANYFHDRIRDLFNARLRTFVESERLGGVVREMDFQLADDTVRRPDVAFISAERLRGVDLERVPATGSRPRHRDSLPTDRAVDLLTKVTQYLAAGTQAVWLFYPKTRIAYRYVPNRLEPEVRSAEAGHSFEELELLSGFRLALSQIFE